MNLYLDTSSLLKLFIREHSSEGVRDIVARAARRSTSRISTPEARGGLARAARGLRLTPDELHIAETELRSLFEGMQVVDVTAALLEDAGDLAVGYYLRGLDAIHLASAVTLQNALGEPITFSAFDDRLNQAAADCGLTVPGAETT